SLIVQRGQETLQMSHRLSRAATTAICYPVVITLVLDPAKRHNEHHSVLCAKRDDKDRPAYVIVAKTK
ncbi:MAG TPA: hypothetical protein VFX63_07965, partial [Pyrinomonadaceae bacterium]|nr:hypothetical protein [Pyrinomonadaceae bacterium]